MDEGLNTFGEARGDGRGYHADLPAAALFRRLHPVRVQGHPARPRDRLEPVRGLPAQPEDRSAVDAELPVLSRPGRRHHLQQDRVVAEHAGALARLADVQRTLSTYFARWQFKHPKPEDFFDIANEVAGRDLGWFFDQVYRSSNVFDYGIQDLRSDREGGTLPHRRWSSRRYGEAIFPIDVRVTFADGEQVIEHWDGQDRWHLYAYDRPRTRASRPRPIPDRVLLLDVNETNNSRTLRAARRARARPRRNGRSSGWSGCRTACSRGACSYEPAARAWRDGIRRVAGAPLDPHRRLADDDARQPAARARASRRAQHPSRRQPGRRDGGERRELRVDAGVRRPGHRARHDVQADDPRLRRRARQPERVHGQHGPAASSSSARRARTSLLWLFVAGGIIDRYARDRATGVHGFFSASGVFFFRFLRLAIVMFAVYGLLFGYLHPWLFDRVYPRLIREVNVERDRVLHPRRPVPDLRPRPRRPAISSSTTRRFARSSRIGGARWAR